MKQQAAVMVTSRDGLIKAFSRAAERMLGVRAQAVVGKLTPVAFHDETEWRRRLPKPKKTPRALETAAFRLIVAKAGLRRPSEAAWTYVRRDGHRFPVIVSITAFPAEGGRVGGYVFVIHDTSRQLHTEQMLRRQAELLDLANDAILVRDLKRDTITYWNDGAVRLYGWSNKEALGAYIHKFLHTKFPRPLPEVKRKFLANGFWNGELVHTTKTGKRITVSSRWTLLRDANGVPEGSLELNTDITTQKHAQAVLEAAHEELERRVTERTAALSEANERLRVLSRRLMEIQETERRAIARDLHDEVGQALTAIRLNLQEIRDAPKSQSVEKEIVDSMQVLDQVLQHVRSIALDLRPSLLDELGLVPALRWYVAKQAERAGWHVDFQVEGMTTRPSPDVEIACFRLTQEALTNVVRHASAQRVKVSLRSDRGTLVLIVRDDGVGFEPQLLRSDPRAQRTVGLSGMEERVRLVGGQFALSSARRQGTEVRATFQLDEGERR